MKCPRLNKKQTKMLIIAPIVFIMGILAVVYLTKKIHSSGYEIRLNNTQSLPQTIWLVNKNQVTNFKTGQYFSFYAPGDTMLTHGESTPVLKMVGATAGVYVSIVNHRLLINGYESGVLWYATERNHILTPIESQVIESGCYFAWTPALYSYDSRYKDIGIVCEKDHRIYGSATPLF